tara:strand:- start:116 stop:301 length:186 start_codon:yes stop_codon:yes gene_type:complete
MSWKDILKSVYRMTHTGRIYTLKDTQVRNGITIYTLEDEEGKILRGSSDFIEQNFDYIGEE